MDPYLITLSPSNLLTRALIAFSIVIMAALPVVGEDKRLLGRRHG